MQVNGVWKTEIVRDAAVLRAYVKGRQALEEETTSTTTLQPTGNAEKDERAYKRSVFSFIPNVLSHLAQTGVQAARGNHANEEEPGTSTSSQECQDCCRGWHSLTAQSTHQTRYHGMFTKLPWVLLPLGSLKPHSAIVVTVVRWDI